MILDKLDALFSVLIALQLIALYANTVLNKGT